MVLLDINRYCVIVNSSKLLHWPLDQDATALRVGLRPGCRLLGDFAGQRAGQVGWCCHCGHAGQGGLSSTFIWGLISFWLHWLWNDVFNARTTWLQRWRLPTADTTFLSRSQWQLVKTTAGGMIVDRFSAPFSRASGSGKLTRLKAPWSHLSLNFGYMRLESTLRWILSPSTFD